MQIWKFKHNVVLTYCHLNDSAVITILKVFQTRTFKDEMIFNFAKLNVFNEY